jgi:hypothetical protein
MSEPPHAAAYGSLIRRHDREEPSAMSNAVKGPASYFPSIEKKYGRPVEEWKQLVRDSPLTRHMELVAWLKSEHGIGHGHANAIVAHTLAETVS